MVCRLLGRPTFLSSTHGTQSDRKCLADLASGERRERFGAGSIYIPYSIKSQLELQSEFPNHMIAIDSHCASVKKKTVAIQVTMELFFCWLRPFWPFGICVPKKFISLFSVQVQVRLPAAARDQSANACGFVPKTFIERPFKWLGNAQQFAGSKHCSENIKVAGCSGCSFRIYIWTNHSIKFYKYIIMRNTLQLKPVNLMFRLRHTQTKSIL